MARYAQRLIREVIEVTSGTAVATTTANGILARNVTLHNLEAEYQARDYVTGTEGAQGDDVNNVRSGADYDVDAAPPATAGAAPAYAHLLRSSGMAMADDDGDTVFKPLALHLPIPSCTMNLRNGAVTQNVAGVRGSFSFEAETGRKPFFRFSRRGKYVAPIAHVQEAHDFSSWPQALTASPENMFAFTLGGTKLCCTSFRFSDGRQPQPATYMNCDDTTLTPRNFTGSMTVKWPALASKDLLTQIHAGVTEPLIWTIGLTPAQTIQITAPRVQIKFAGEQNIQGDLGIGLDLVFLPTGAGDDEIEIRFPGE